MSYYACSEVIADVMRREAERSKCVKQCSEDIERGLRIVKDLLPFANDEQGRRNQ